MSIFNNLMEGIGLRRPDYGRLRTELPPFNAQPAMDRLKALEAKVDAPITGVSEAGAAAQDAARASFEDQTQRAQKQMASDAASRAANIGIFGGASSGAVERGQEQAGERASQLAQAQAGNQSRLMGDIAAQDIAGTQAFQRSGLMALPGMHTSLESARTGRALQAAGMQMGMDRTNAQLGLQERAARQRALGGFGSMLFGRAGSSLGLFG